MLASKGVTLCWKLVGTAHKERELPARHLFVNNIYQFNAYSWKHNCYNIHLYILCKKYHINLNRQYKSKKSNKYINFVEHLLTVNFRSLFKINLLLNQDSDKILWGLKQNMIKQLRLSVKNIHKQGIHTGLIESGRADHVQPSIFFNLIPQWDQEVLVHISSHVLGERWDHPGQVTSLSQYVQPA